MEEPVAEPSAEPQMARMREPVEIIGQLNKLTQEEKISWHSAKKEAAARYDDDTRIQACYEAKYKGNTLRLTRMQTKRYQTIEDIAFAYRLRLTHTMHRDKKTLQEFYWDNALVLELIDPDGAIVWSPNYVSILEGLLTSVQHQVTRPVYKNFVTEIFAEG